MKFVRNGRSVSVCVPVSDTMRRPSLSLLSGSSVVSDASCTPGRAFATAGLIMTPWVLYLSMSLPKKAMDSHWALAWVGLDSCEALALFATGRFLKRADNRCTLTATAAAALLLTDAWFDVTAATPGGELAIAIVMAVCVEIPIAIVCTVLALRLIRHPFPQSETAEQESL